MCDARPAISADALQAAADHGLPADPGTRYDLAVARHCTTEALVEALRERGLATASDERVAVVWFLRHEEQKFALAATNDAASEEAQARCSLRASTLRTVAAYIERGDHAVRGS